LLWVEKLPDHTIVAHCMICKQEEIYVHDWEMTDWASGPMEPVPAEAPSDPSEN